MPPVLGVAKRTHAIHVQVQFGVVAKGTHSVPCEGIYSNKLLAHMLLSLAVTGMQQGYDYDRGRLCKAPCPHCHDH